MERPDTIVAAATAMKAGETSAERLTEEALAQIEAHDGALCAHVAVDGEAALAEARARDRERRAGRTRGPLHGVPIGIKDLIDIAGKPTLGGMTVRADAPPAANDATAVRLLREAGAVILGKHQMSEGAGVAHHPSVDPPRNPWSLDHWPGISSSGTGVAVAADFCFAGLGTDTGGSVRIPAAACGLTGMKPSYGRVSRAGLLPLAQSLDHIGPLARSAEDAALVLAAIAGRDPADPTSLPGSLKAPVKLDLNGVRIGLDDDWNRRDLAPPVAAALDRVEAVLRELGAELIRVSMPSTQAIMSVGLALVVAEQAANHRDTWPSRRAEYGPELALSLAALRQVDATTIAAAGLARDALRGDLAELFTRIDLLLCPVLPIGVPTLAEMAAMIADPATISHRLIRYVAPFDFAGTPALSLPAGQDEAGLPVAVQLVGPQGADGRVLAAAMAVQAITDWHEARPNLL
ncbi:amidase [Sphingomonas sp.]|uniref:amidase n=1 Tax=Sphingomonas sp. TaxID=28214 RepID=UPI003B00E3A6